MEFAEAAERFCAVVDAADRLALDAFCLKLSVALTDLYGAALRLPDMEPDTDDLHAERMTTSEWEALYHSLQRKFGNFDQVWEMFDPSVNEKEPVAASLSDAIADIYRSVRSGIGLARRGASPADVLWSWRFSFTSHWGHHAVDVIRALHSRVVQLQDDE